MFCLCSVLCLRHKTNRFLFVCDGKIKRLIKCKWEFGLFFKSLNAYIQLFLFPSQLSLSVCTVQRQWLWISFHEFYRFKYMVCDWKCATCINYNLAIFHEYRWSKAMIMVCKQANSRNHVTARSEQRKRHKFSHINLVRFGHSNCQTRKLWYHTI